MSLNNSKKYEIRAGGRIRTMTVVPPRDGDAAVALLVLHGSNQTGAKFRRFTGGDLDGFAAHGPVAYLDGYRGGWNDARRSSPLAARRDDVDDVAFVRAAMAELSATLGSGSFAVLGYSAGGAMVLRLLLELPGELAGAVIISATQPVPGNLLPVDHGAVPLPVALIHGTRDRLVPYEGGVASLWGLRPRGLGLSAPETAVYLAGRNGIAGASPVTEPLPSFAQRQIAITRTRYVESAHPPVELYTVGGGGHTVPGPHRAPIVLGRTARLLRTRTVTEQLLGLPVTG
jgi:polyhydroxybutyrate depolymerase